MRRNRIKASLGFIAAHILRAPLKFVLVAGVSMFFVAAMGLLYNAIVFFEQEVERLYDTTVVTGELRKSNRHAYNYEDVMQNDIIPATVSRILARDYFQSYYLDTVVPFFRLTPTADAWAYTYESPLLGISDLHQLIMEHGMTLIITEQAEFIPTIDMVFAEGFDEADFVYTDPYLQEPIPVIVCEQTLGNRGLSVGDSALIKRVANRQITEIPVIIIGRHCGGIDREMGAGSILMPISAARYIVGPRMNYTTFRFEIDPVHNRNIDEVRDSIMPLVRNTMQREFMPLTMDFRDEELRVVVGQMERSLSLLQMFYPVAVALSIAIGAGFAVLLLLQNARNMAVIRVLGCTKIRARAMFGLEYIIIAVVGAAAGLIAIPLLGIEFTAHMPLMALLYIVGAVVGVAVGVTVISRRAPLDLLQVRE